jgi:hypothetical protein
VASFGRKQVLPCGPSLGKVAVDGVRLMKVFPYYGTNLGASILLAGAK